MRRRHLAEAGKAEVDLRHAAGVAGCPKAALGMAPVDPAGAQPGTPKILRICRTNPRYLASESLFPFELFSLDLNLIGVNMPEANDKIASGQ